MSRINIEDHMDKLNAMAGKLERRYGRLSKDDLVQLMVVAALEHQSWPERLTASYIEQHCLFAALKAIRQAGTTFGYEVVSLDAEAEAADAPDFGADPEQVILHREERAQVRSWFESILAGDELTPAQRRTVAAVQAAAATPRAERRRATPAERAGKAYHLRRIRAQYPHPLTALAAA